MRIDIDQLAFIDRSLRDMVGFLERKSGIELTVTSLYRIGDSGVHGQLPLRGIDVRVRDEPVGRALRKLINLNWTYDPDRPGLKCAILHGRSSNLHLHLQTHPNTI